MSIDKLLTAFFKEVLKEIESNKSFRERITILFEKGDALLPGQNVKKRSNRRKPGVFDPMNLYREQPEQLKSNLEKLTNDELKDIIAEHSMDRTKLALKWKDKERLIELILTTVQTRDQKGDAFRNNPKHGEEEKTV